MKKMLFVASAASLLAITGAAIAAPAAAGSSAAATQQASNVRTPTHAANASQSSADLYRAVQSKLKADNLYNGPINGRRTDATIQAITSFQVRNHLAQTGRLDAPTRHALGV